MEKEIKNEQQFKSLNKIFWLFVAGLPIIVLLRFFITSSIIEYFTAIYSIFFLGVWFFARYIAFPSYFYLKYDSSKISVKFRPFNFFDAFGLFSKNGVNLLEIDKEHFDGYKIKEKYAGLRRSLILYKKTDHGEVKPNTINISFLTVNEISLLIRALHTFRYKNVS